MGEDIVAGESKKIIITAVKKDNNTLTLTKQLPSPSPTVVDYDRTFIENQIIAIQRQWDSQLYDINTKRQAEIDECREILDLMDANGVAAK